MTYSFSHSTVTSNNPEQIRKLHLFWVCQPKMQGRKMRYWGYTKEEAYQKAKANNPGASILWKKEL